MPSAASPAITAPPSPVRNRSIEIGVVAACTAMLLFRFGHAFEANDQLQYLLLPYRAIYDSFLPGDWFTWHTAHYHLVFSWIVRFLHAAWGEAGLPAAALALHIAVLGGLSASALALSRAAGLGLISGAAGLLVLAISRQTGLAGAVLNHGVLVPADLAMPCFLLGAACWIARQEVRAGLLLGLGGLLHPNFALLGPAVFVPLVTADAWRARSIRPVAQLSGGFLALAWPSLVLIAARFTVPDAAPEALSLVFDVRSPHHYSPALPWSQDVLWLLALLAVGLGAAIALWQNPRGRRLAALILVLLFSQVAAGLATALDIGPAVRLFLWRLSVPLALGCAIAAAQAMREALLSKRANGWLFAAAAVAVLTGFCADGKVSGPLHLEGSARLAPAVLFLAIAALLRKSFAKASLASAAAVLLSVALASLPLFGNRPIDWVGAAKQVLRTRPVRASIEPASPELERLYAWVRAESPPRAAFAVPPGFDKFRLRARRAVLVDWKCCPMRGDEALEWKRRMLVLMGVSDFPARGYALVGASNALYLKRSAADLARLATREKLTHVICREQKDARNAGLKELARFGDYRVYELFAPAASPR